MKKILISVFSFLIFLSCSESGSGSNEMDAISDISSHGCNSIKDCSEKETKDSVCIKKGCIGIGEASEMLHIVFYPKYISSVLNNISYFRYYYFYPLDVSGNNISCENLLSSYDFDNMPGLNLIQTYEKQGTISATGSEMYTLPLPQIKDSLIFFIFYQNNGDIAALGCAEKIDITSGNSIGIFPCKPEQINACLGQF